MVPNERDDAMQLWGLRIALECIAQVGHFQKVIPDNWQDLAAPGSALEQLLGELPKGPVDLRQTIWEGLWTAWTCLESAAQIFRRERESTPQEVMVLLRPALLASARIVFAIAPHAQPDRRERAVTVMQQEAKSLLRLYRDAEGFGSHISNLPPEDERRVQRETCEKLLEGSQFMGDAMLLREMARVSAELVNAERAPGAPEVPFDPKPHADDLLWVFNVYSAVAHGLAWPLLMWRSGSYPTDIVGDLWLVAMIADRAHQITLDEAGIERPQILAFRTMEGADPSEIDLGFAPLPPANPEARPFPRAQPRKSARSARRGKPR